MRKPVAVFVAFAAICGLCGVALAGGPRSAPQRYLPGSLDGDLTYAFSASDRTSYAAWAYRNGAEYDIALSHTDGRGRWTEPVFFGAGDGRDQIEPALTIDGDNTVYLAYTDAATDGIRLTALLPDATRWTEPLVVRDRAPQRAYSSPSLLIVDQRLIVAYSAGGRTAILDLPRDLFAGGISALTITESSDPVEYRPGDDRPGVGSGEPDNGRPVEVLLPIPKKANSTQPY